MAAFDKLSEAHAELYAAIRVIHAYGRPADPQGDNFDEAVTKAIDDAKRISDELPNILCNARLDEQIEHIEILKDAQAERNSALALWSLWEEIHEEIEKLHGDYHSAVSMVERTAYYKILGFVARKLETTK